MHRPLLTTAALLFLFSFPTRSDANIQWTQVSRIVGGEVIVTNSTEFALDIDSRSSAALGSFVATTSVDTTVAGVSGSSTSGQDSDLFATGLTGSGAFETATEVTDPEGFADVFGRSQFTGHFDVDAPTSFSLTGLLTTGGLGTSSQMALFGPGGFIVDVMGSPAATVPVSASGTLAPGAYVVFVNMAGNAQEAPPNVMSQASGQWEMRFFLGGVTATPAAATAFNMSVFPNPARERIAVSLGPRMETPVQVRVHDVSGRLVRAIEVTAGTATWDRRDTAGRLVSAGTYFLTARHEELLATGRVTVLR